MAIPNPDISAKLAAPAKKSVFERQKAEAEAKKAREKAETAAALENFVKSFEDDGDQQSGLPPRRGGNEGGRGGFGPGSSTGYGSSGPGKRHFTSSGIKSGPGSLGPSPSNPRSGPGSLVPAPGYGKKRHYDEYSGRDRDRDRERRDRIFSYGDDMDDNNNRRDSAGFTRDEEEDAKDTEELKAAAKPTLHLSSLAPGTSPAVIKGLFAPSPLAIESVRILPSAPGSATDRKSISAIVTLVAETPAADIDTMVSHLQNKYLGFGFNLSISRHLSSAALTGAGSLGNNALSSNLHSLPFGAKPVVQHTSLSRAPPPGQGPSRFVPPTSYTSSTPYGSRTGLNSLPPTQINVQIPTDVKQLRLIHKTIEALLTYGAEFEALLMSRPHIQADEQWSWLWNSRSTAGVYYRWRLWEILTGSKSRGPRQDYSGYGARQPRGDVLFEGQSTWLTPEENLKFEYTTRIDQFISDEDYNSSDEEDTDEDRGGGLARRYQDHQRVVGNANADTTADNDGQGYLNPLAKAKLVHLLSRLPETNAKLRKGDVARVTGFAIEHAGAGADEVAELITSNVVNPFRYSVKRPEHETLPENNDSEDIERTGGTPQRQLGTDIADIPSADKQDTAIDSTPASLLALYLISDILSAASTSGVRHAWRYRSLFQHHLVRQKTFDTLGQLPKKYQWGKLRAEKWRRQVQVVLGLWEGWCVFEEGKMRDFNESFLNAGKEEEQKKAEKEAGEKRDKDKSVSRWRSVEGAENDMAGAVDGRPMFSGAAAGDSDVDMNMDGTPMADEDEDDEGDTVLTDENIDGVPMQDSSDEAEEEQGQDEVATVAGSTQRPELEEAAGDKRDPAAESKPVHVALVSQGRRMRPKATDFDDMFE